MQVVVIGCGKIGVKFAKKMSSLNNDVTIIDKEKELTKKISKEFDGRVINGLEFDKTVLESANVKEADCIVVSTASDNTNIMVAQVLNKIFGVKNIIICLQNPSLAKIYEDSSFKIICPTNIITDKIIEIMDK